VGTYLPVLLAFALTAILTLSLRPLALRFQLTDKPGGRKRHVGEIPLVGGIAMLIAIIVALEFVAEPASHASFLIPAAIFVVVGAVDDRYGIRASVRIGAQIGAVLVMMIAGGLYLRDIGDPFGTGILGLGFLSIPLSILITLCVINAYNFADGIDGLAASLALITLAAGALASGLAAPATLVATIACGAILGFMLFNLPGLHNRRLRTFMGDAGSTLLGFIVVWFTVTISQGEGRALSPVAALWFALMPLADFFSCVVRRVAKGRLPFHAGRDHFHHILMRAGLNGRQVLTVLVCFGVFYSSVGLIGANLRLPDWTLFAPWITLLATQHLIVRRIAVQVRCRRWKAAKEIVAPIGKDAAQLERPEQIPVREAA